MPDSGIMLDLCELLKINVNELLSGERIMAEAYDKRAEENLLAMSFPRDIKRPDNHRLTVHMAGNAVPPLAGKRIIQALVEAA